MSPNSLRERAAKMEAAQKRGAELLSKKFTEEEKIAIFDRVSLEGRSWMEQMVQHGMVSRHTSDALKGELLEAMWGDDLHEWIYDLQQK